MTPMEQQIAIAEACGWVRDNVCDNWRKPAEGPYAIAFLNGSIHHRQLPDYLNDLNAMHKAEIAALTTLGSFNEYDSWLCKVTGYSRPICADAHERAEALLHTIGKWVEA